MAFDKSSILDVNSTAPQTRITSGRRIFKNALFNSGGWVINVAIALLITPYIVHKLSLEGYGIYALLSGLVGYYALLDLGLGQAVTKFVAQYKALGDEEGIRHSINAALCVQVVTGFIGSLMLIIFAEHILRLLRVPSFIWNDAKIGVYISASGLFFTMVTGTLVSALMGLQRYDLSSKVNVATTCLLNLLIVYILYLGYGLKEVLLATSGSAIITFIVFLFVLRRALPSWRGSLMIDVRHLQTLFSFSGYMFLSKSSDLFISYLMRFIIGFLLGPAAVTYYVVPMKIIVALSGFLGSITTVLFPLASELNAGQHRELLQKAYLKASRYMLTLALPNFLLLIIFSKEILTVWMGAEFAAESWLTMSLLAAAYFFATATMVAANITYGLGHSAVNAVFSMAVLVIGTTCVTSFTSAWGIAGAAGSICMTQLIVGPSFILYATKKLLRISVKNYLKQVVSFHVLASVGAVTLLFFLRMSYEMSNLTVLFLSFSGFLTLYYGASLLTQWIRYRDLIGLVSVK